MIGTKQILRVKTDAELRAFAAKQAAATGLTVRTSHQPLVAEINHGRWVVTCDCGATLAADPTLTLAACFLHRHPDDPAYGLEVVLHDRLTFPDAPTVKRLEQALHKRQLNKQRNWTPRESAGDLERENADHGVKE